MSEDEGGDRLIEILLNNEPDLALYPCPRCQLSFRVEQTSNANLVMCPHCHYWMFIDEGPPNATK